MLEKPAQQHPPGGYPARSAEAYRGPVALLNATGGRYVEVPSDARTPLEGFCNILSLMPVREGKVVEPGQLDLAEVKGLAGIQTPMTGTMSAKVSLHGSQLNPVGQGNVTLTNATIADEPIQSANINFQGTGDELRSRLTVQIGEHREMPQMGGCGECGMRPAERVRIDTGMGDIPVVEPVGKRLERRRLPGAGRACDDQHVHAVSISVQPGRAAVNPDHTPG